MHPFNEQFAAATRQFAQTAGEVNRLALDHAGAVLGLQLAAVGDRIDATLAFWGEAVQARDLDGLRELLPKGAQLARGHLERAAVTGQELVERSLRAQARLGEIARTQFDQATPQAADAGKRRATK